MREAGGKQNLWFRKSQTDLPNTDIHVIGAGENVGCIAAESGGKDSLHALCVVDFTAVAAIVGEDPDRAIIASSHKLSACGRVVDIHDSRNKILENRSM